MAALALGLAGGLIGGPIGFLAGSLLGNLLFPQKVDGPRLSDLRLHTSSTGGMLPILYGTMRIAGNVIWETDLTEHDSGGGGKGGGDNTNTATYTASFAVALCEGPIAGISRIWGNGRLIFDPNAPAGSLGTPLPMVIYFGDETQVADATMEAVLGVGNVPAFRGVAYVVFADYQLAQWSNTLPNLEFEVYTNVATFPIRIANIAYPRPGEIVSAYDPTTGVVTVDVYNIHGDGFTPLAFNEFYYKLDGTPTTQSGLPPGVFSQILDQTVGLSFGVDCVISNSLFYANGGSWWKQGANLGTIVGGSPWNDGVLIHGVTADWVFCTDQGAHGISRYPVASGLVSLAPDLFYTFGGTLDANYGSSDNHLLYMYRTDDHSFYEFDENLSLLRSWTAAQFVGIAPTSIIDQTFMVYNKMVVFSVAGLSFDDLVLLDITDTALTLNPKAINPFAFQRGPVISLGGGYALGSDGLVLLNPPIEQVTLASMVADQSLRAGFDSSQYGVTQLTQLVNGALVDSQRAARDNISEWQQSYFFDGAEVDGKVVFVNRGGQPVLTIDDNDLATFAQGETPPPQVGIVRTAQADLPQQVTVNYVAPDQDYQTGTQLAQRQTVNLQNPNKVTLDLKISLPDGQALAIAYKQLYSAYVERQKSTTSVPRKYAQLVPTDVVNIKGNAIAIRQTSWTLAGAIKLDGVPSYAQVVQQQAPTAVPPINFTSTPPVPSTLATTLADPLDLPLIADVDRPDGYYLAMCGNAGQWLGAAWMQSNDGGANYANVFSETTPQIIGTCSTALGPWDGSNNIVDAVNSLTVTMADGGTLSSVTLLAMFNGANECAVGTEVLQFMTAELIAPKTYVVSNFLRGRQGTEWAIGGHGIGERFAMLPAPRVASPFSDLNVDRLYKPVSFGGTLAAVTAQPFVNTGMALRPYAPVQLGGGIDASGNATLTWVRRTRIGGAWSPFVDVPLSEASQQWIVQIWNAAFAQVARIITTTTPSAAYSAADQTTDFGALPLDIFFTVAQVGQIGIGNQASGSIVGAGSSNVDPLNPIPPYQSPTSGAGSPPPPPGSLALAMGWANVRKNSSSVGTFDCSHIVVASFTTPAATANGVLGWIGAVEHVDGRAGRLACLSTIAGDFTGSALGANTRVRSQDPTVFFSVGTNSDGYVQLAPSTTYYFNVANDDGFGVCTCMTGSCGIAVELNKPHGL